MAEGTFEVVDENFDKQVLNSEIPVLVDFWAPWCGPCLSIAPMLEGLAKEFAGKIKIAKMNVDENANIPSSVGVRSIPYLALFKGGELVDSIVGNVPRTELINMFNRALN